MYVGATVARPHVEAVLVREGSDIAQPAQLKGKRIALNKGSNVHYFLVKLLDKEMSKGLLGKLDERNAKLSASIRKKLFGFEDLNRLTASDLQRALREVDSANLATAMKSASDALKAKIYAGISKRAAESLKDEIEMLGAVRAKDIDAAQDGIIQVVRKLEEEGHISLDSEPQGVAA